MDINILKTLREKTGAGIADCRAALQASNGDMEKAIEFLRKQGQVKAAKKTERATAEGVIGSYIHANKKVAGVVVLQCETDFVARNETFVALARDLAMHVAPENPLYLSQEDVPESVIAKENEIYQEQLQKEGKSGDMIIKILPGKLKKYYEETCLLEQTFIKDDTKKVKDLLSEAVLKLGENMKITEFRRFSL